MELHATRLNVFWGMGLRCLYWGSSLRDLPHLTQELTIWLLVLFSIIRVGVSNASKSLQTWSQLIYWCQQLQIMHCNYLLIDQKFETSVHFLSIPWLLRFVFFFVCVTSGIWNLNPTTILAESVQGNFFGIKKTVRNLSEMHMIRQKQCVRYKMLSV